MDVLTVIWRGFFVASGQYKQQTGESQHVAVKLLMEEEGNHWNVNLHRLPPPSLKNSNYSAVQKVRFTKYNLHEFALRIEDAVYSGDPVK